MLKIVIDTVVFVRSLINPHNKAGKILFTHFRLYQIFISEPIVTEILEVLKRPELTGKFRSLKLLDINRIISILGQAQGVDIQKIPSISRDPKDDKFLITSHKAKADYLITEDKDLLIIKEYKGVKIISTETFLRILEKKT